MVTYKGTKQYPLRGSKIVTPRFCSCSDMKNSINYRGAVLWNTASRYYDDNFKQFYAKVRKDDLIKQINMKVAKHSFRARSACAQALHKTKTWRQYSDHFICSMSPLSVLFFFTTEHNVLMVFYSFITKVMLEKVTMQRTQV